MTAAICMFEHAIWCQGKGDMEMSPNGSKMFPLEMERSMIIRGTAIGELAYPNDPWMTTASATGFCVFMLCEQYDQHQLKAHASKPRAKTFGSTEPIASQERRCRSKTTGSRS